MKLSEKGIIIRKICEGDLHQVYSAGKSEPLFQNLSYPFSAENLAEIFSSENSICLAAVRKKKVLGFIIGSVKEKESIISCIMVNEKLRKTGIGKELFRFFMEESKKAGCIIFLIDVLKNDPQSVAFFAEMGFAVENTFVKLKLKSHMD